MTIILNNDHIAAHHLKQLKILDLGFNRFNGSILSYLTAITSLTTLIIDWNFIHDFNPTQGMLISMKSYLY